MICRLFELSDAAGTDIFEFEHCNEECQYWSDKCSICFDVNIALTSEKYSWAIDLIINFKEPVPTKNQKTLYDKMIKVIHPFYSDFWIFRSMKAEDMSVLYFLYVGTSQFHFKDIQKLNDLLNERCHYTGRPIEDNDFIMGDN